MPAPRLVMALAMLLMCSPAFAADPTPPPSEKALTDEQLKEFGAERVEHPKPHGPKYVPIQLPSPRTIDRG